VREEWVVLVDEEDRPIGRARKTEVHHAATPLHRGFSLFLFDAAGRTLVQRRSAAKRTFHGLWSNSCCGHPAPGESVLAAARRRARDELGAAPRALAVLLADFRYRAEADGVVENELCPVLVGEIEGEPLRPDPAEVAELRWLGWPELLAELAAHPESWSSWSAEEARTLDAAPAFHAWRAARGAAAS
jgi:isopentenyl-diphosphate delta-isomerase type 1